MKKILFIISLFLLFNQNLYAQELSWKVMNQVTVGWDAVTTMITKDGPKPIPEGDQVKYELYLVSYNSTDRELDKKISGETALLEFTYTFTNEGRWIAGVAAIRIPKDHPDERLFSAIVWSDSDDVPEKFGFVFYNHPGKVKVFKPK